MLSGLPALPLPQVRHSEEEQDVASIVDLEQLPAQFPTRRHDPAFWEMLGRVVATYGFLEEVLGKAIFSFSSTRHHEEHEIEGAFKKWLPTLVRALYDPLGGLISSYEKAVRDNQSATIANLDELTADLRKAAKLRNVLCHGPWRLPDENGASRPFFVNNKKEVFDTAIGIDWLAQVQRHVAELACAVVNTVTHMGWQFPGSKSPGEPIFERRRQ